MDNYRGFSDTYVPVRDVNFLVGENSTGKTSFLALLQILSDSRFWFTQNFTTEEVQLGTFRDIVSVSARRKSRFRIGIIDSTGDELTAFLLTFREEKGLPTLARYDYCGNDKEVAVLISKGGGLRYRINPARTDGAEGTKRLLSMFRKWTINGQNLAGFKLLKGSQRSGMRVAPSFIPSLVEVVEAERRGEEKASFSPMIPELFEGLAWLAPVRNKPRRTYDQLSIDFTAEGGHTPYLVKSLLAQQKLGKAFLRSIERFGKDSGLFDSVLVRNYGEQAASPFALNVLLNGKQLNIKNVGYGVSQSLPVIVEIFARTKKTWFAIQQPEIHLHPKAQAAIGDFIFALAVGDQKRFLIETHSDYIIDRFRLHYRKAKRTPNSQVLFFERRKGENKVWPIEIGKTGEYPRKQPKAFRDFFIKEELRLLAID